MFESLESRKFFSVAVVGNVLTVTGTTKGERVGVAWDKTSATTWDLRINVGKKISTTSYNSASPAFTSVYLYGGNGADYLSATATVPGFTNTYVPPVPVSLNAGAGNDTVHGGETADSILGGSGDDSLFGHTGNDTIRGEGGNDSVQGDSGNDSLFGDAGDDSMVGNIGDDVMDGGAGNDLVDGGEGNDLASGGAGADAVFAGTTSSPPFLRATNTDLGMDTLFGSENGSADDAGDVKYL